MIQIKIDACAYGAKGASFAVLLTMEDYQWSRSIKCGKITSNQAEMKAIEYALKSIKPDFENEPVAIKTSGRYAKMMLAKKDGEWAKSSRKNADIVTVVREQYSRFEDISLEHENMVDMRDITLCAAKGDEIFNKKGI